MALIILDGVIQEIGFGSIVDGQRVISFVKLNGVRTRDIVCDDYMRSFLVVGKKVKLALVRRLLGMSILYSVKLEDGEVFYKDKGLPVVMVFMLGVGFSLLLSPIFMMIIHATHSILVSLLILVGAGMGMAYVVMRDHFKARKVFQV
ncbi:hypothetical protein ACIOYV_10855 [Pseudomonas sp. NPDC087342]|uniref:hypothetical protein n=1 Tax=Pseudomonas sp. NPDC087342 TaxID=3364437 RepID=UPI0038188B28